MYRSDDMNAYLGKKVYEKDESCQRYCFDFEFSQDKTILAMMCRASDISDEVFDRYEYSDVVMSKIEQTFDSLTEKRELLLFTNQKGAFDDIVQPQAGRRPSADEIRELSSNNYISLLGVYSPKDTQIRLVYADKNMQLLPDNKVSVCLPQTLSITIGFFDDGTSHVMADESTYEMSAFQVRSDNVQRIPTGQDIIFAYNSEEGDENLVFAFAALYDGNMNPEYKENAGFEPKKAADGAVLEDLSEPEMNSMDVMSDNIMLLKTKVYARQIRLQD
jgi:hypothetical protein